MTVGLTEAKANVIKMDVPLFIRMLEYGREDAKSDIDLHNVVENILKMQTSSPLTMSDYQEIVKKRKKN